MARHSLGRWMLAVTIAETVGFAVPATVFTVTNLLEAPAGVAYAAIVAAGAVEGALLGLGQRIGFGLPALSRRAWVSATALGAAIAWSIGLLPSTLGGLDFGSPLVIALVGVGGLVLLASIPTLQWVVLRRLVHPSFFWAPVNMGAWAVGLLWTFAPSPFVDESTPTLVIVIAFLLGGMLMALTVAALTGLAARQVVRLASQPDGTRLAGVN